MTPTNQEIQNFQPKCLGGKGYKARSIAIAVSATGFVLPCCWLNQTYDVNKHEKVRPLFDDKLHIDNNDTIDDIIYSEPWQTFMRDLIEKPEKSAPICFRKCTKTTHRIQKEL